jgi:thioredoxin reductase (NADPH)
METYDVIVIGAGPAGLSAAIYTARAGLKTLILEREFPGGRLAKAPKIENYPGVMKTSGPELVATMKQQAERFGAEIRSGEDVVQLELAGDEKIVRTHSGNAFKALAVIVAIGTNKKKLVVPGEEKFLGSGVSYCAICDAPFYRDKVVVIVGNGQEAGEEAIILSEFAKEVIIIPNGELEMEHALLEDLKNKSNVSILEDTRVREIKGDSMVSSILVEDLNGDNGREIPVGGVFISLGGVPMSNVIKNAGINVDNGGCIIVDRNQRTNIEGVFAAGECTCGGMQAITSAGEGAMAGIKASSYVKKKKRGK